MKTEMAFTMDGLRSAYPHVDSAKEVTIQREPGLRLSLTSQYEDGGRRFGVSLSPEQAIALSGALKSMADLLVATKERRAARKHAGRGRER